MKPDRIIAFAALAALAACGHTPAVIGDINDSSVKVVRGSDTPEPEIMAEAQRGCGIYGKAAVPVSRWEIEGGKSTHLFACK